MSLRKFGIICIAVGTLTQVCVAQKPRGPKASRFTMHEDFRPWWVLDDVRWISSQEINVRDFPTNEVLSTLPVQPPPTHN